MNTIVSLIKEIGTSKIPAGSKMIYGLLESKLGEDAPTISFLMVRGPITKALIPVFNLPKTKQLLVWSPGLEAVVDLASIKASKLPVPTCYQSMFEFASNKHLGSWVKEVRTLAGGAYMSVDAELMADLVANSNSAGSPLKELFVEIMRKHYLAAIQ